MKKDKLTKKKDKGNGVSISELQEVLKRVKNKEPELSEVVDRLRKLDKAKDNSALE